MSLTGTCSGSKAPIGVGFLKPLSDYRNVERLRPCATATKPPSAVDWNRVTEASWFIKAALCFWTEKSLQSSNSSIVSRFFAFLWSPNLRRAIAGGEMEALAAVALAGNVLQFAEFGIKLLTASGELYGREDLTSNARIQESIDRIRAISNEGITQCDDFKRKLRRATGPDALPVLVQNDARIVKLSHECLDTAQDLQNILDKLKLPRNAPSRGWRSLLIAIKSVASEPEIEAHLAKLRNIKSEIGSTVISSLR